MKVFARKKPAVIEAIQYTGLINSAYDVIDFCGKDAFVDSDGQLKIRNAFDRIVSIGDMVIKDVNGEFYPCKKDIFDKNYEIFDENAQAAPCCQEDHDGEFIHDFSWALWQMKQGKKIHRSGWNGKGMFAVLQKGYPDGIPCNKQTAEAWGLKEGDLFRCEPYMQLKMVNGSHSMWVPSVNDCLSNDWAIVKEL